MPQTPKAPFKAPPAALARRLSPPMPGTPTPAVETPPAADARRASPSAVEEWFNLPDLPPPSTEGPLSKAPPQIPSGQASPAARAAPSTAAAVAHSPKPPPPQLPPDFHSDSEDADGALSAAPLPLVQPLLRPPAAARTSTEKFPVPAPCAVAPHLPPGPVTPPPHSGYGSPRVHAASPPCTAPLPSAVAPMDTPPSSIPVVDTAEHPSLSTTDASPPAAAARAPPPDLPPTYVTRHSPSFCHKPPRKEMRALLHRKTLEINGTWHRAHPGTPYWEPIPNTETSPWVHYLTTLPAAHKDIVFEDGTIASFGVASFVDELDPNTGFPRVDFQAWRSDGVTHIRLHPGSTSSNDAEPIYNSTGLAVDARRNYTAKRRGEAPRHHGA